MGICISIASSEIHGVPEEVHNENVIIFEASKVLSGSERLFSVYSKQGTKGLNQDAASLHQGYGMEDEAFCGVYDGHGKNGHIVSKIVNNRLSSLILSQKNIIENIDKIENGNHVDRMKEVSVAKNFKKWKEVIVSAFRVMDKEVKLQGNLDCSCSGTTAVVVIKQGEGLVIANLGDSRAVLGTIYDEKLVAIQLTTDLKPGLPREAERIRRCNGRVYALKEEPHVERVWLPKNKNSPGLAMSRAFGDFVLKDHGVIAIPDISYHPLTSTDQFIVLATDGVRDVLSNNEVASIVWSVDSEEAAARAVVEAATAAWENKYPYCKVDDCTVVCLFLQKKSQLRPYEK
ncbi:probable protein phosphatase 2C 72 [Abrus precatorius]|uniref:Probable protein phosphatase 2C 72 n=1 Tax=Abrus precatorius TaxID=3816 RepID=A0A8B8JR08_ABRPR|nr:probable protein phosphatase 2C 72 [Abrus precatorius]